MTSKQNTVNHSKLWVHNNTTLTQGLRFPIKESPAESQITYQM